MLKITRTHLRIIPYPLYFLKRNLSGIFEIYCPDPKNQF